MHRRIVSLVGLWPYAIALLAISFLAGLAPAQVNASFSTFGTGCRGTGTGLDSGIQILPASMATRFGSGNAIPFGWTPHRYQEVLSGSELPAAFTMAGLSLRQPNRGPLSNRFTIDLEISVGYTTRTPLTMSTTFAQNFDAGAPVAVVPRAQITIPDMVATGPTSPADFLLTIPWPVTFDWIPAAGRNLLIQVTVFGNSYGGVASGYAFDAGSDPTMARLYSSSPTAATGTLERNLGIVMGFRALTHTAVPALYSTNTPMINDQFRVRVSQARASAAAFVFLGGSSTSWGGSALPMDLGWLGAPGCTLLTSLDDVQGFAINSAGNGSFVYDIPNTIYLLGVRTWHQVMIADPTANAFGYAMTNGGAGVIGNQ
ncbi:MAG: hypothetical protein IPM29_03775 [Planctomycetes bacterium]|nr:hypothetical protein [Planctomycetota bacterium]